MRPQPTIVDEADMNKSGTPMSRRYVERGTQPNLSQTIEVDAWMGKALVVCVYIEWGLDGRWVVDCHAALV